MNYQFTLIQGDGIGPEVSEATVKIIQATGVKIKWDKMIAGQEAIDKEGTPLPEKTVQSILKNKIALKGPITTPIGKGFSSVNVLMRKKFSLFACVRPVYSLPNVSRYKNVNLTIIRENTEGLYAGLEHEIVPGVVESIKVVSEKASTRIAEFAFSYAKKNGFKKVTTIHKANIMKLSDGLFLQCARDVSKKYPKIQHEEMIVDNTCMQLVMRPERFEVLLLENLYGDIVSDLCAGLVGGLGVVPGANIGEEIAIFEAVHGSAPDIAGKGLANPVAMALSGGLLLEHIGEKEAGNKIQKAVKEVLEAGSPWTQDLGGTASTQEITSALIKIIKKL